MDSPNEANASSAIIMVVVFVCVIMLVVGFFGYTCTSGTFDMNKFDASNCFVLQSLLTSNTSTITSSPTIPPTPCGDYTMFSCPPSRCQVDEVQGVCEDSGEPLEEVPCGLAEYQTADTCPIVGCEWGGGQCAQVGELCGYVTDRQTCVNRGECNWDFFRPSYAACISNTRPTSPGDCSVLNNRSDDCTAAPGCVYTDATSTCGPSPT